MLLISCPSFSRNKVELRAAWIATIANIDWPSAYNYNTEKQKAEMIALLDSLQSININAIYFQVRPSSDAFYYSDFEPWSKYLTGLQDKEPDPFYDPLAFVVSEAHARNIDVHAWINPYRVLNSDKISDLHTNHLFFRRPDMFVKYGGKYYFNPALEETRAYLCDVVKDIVARYDIEGVHFDDYFYPYRIQDETFPDHKNYIENSNGFDNIGDWRRNNVNIIIQQLSKVIKDTKPWVEFGISPFGVWRNIDKDPSGSKTLAGQTNYDDLYADVKLWLQNSWIDYVVPQLYWEIGHSLADYNTLLKWWSENTYNHNLYIGLAPYKLASNSVWSNANEICRQLDANNDYDNVLGAAFFSTSALLANELGLCDSLKNNYYKYPALSPSVFSDNKSTPCPSNLRVEKMGLRPYLFWDAVKEGGGYKTAYYVVYMFPTLSEMDISNPKYIFAKTADNCIDISSLVGKMKSSIFVVTTVNKFKRESEMSKYLMHYH